MDSLIPFQWQGQRVLLSFQLKGLFNCHQKNFEAKVRKARSDLQGGVDYFFLVHDDLRTFKRFAHSIGLPVKSCGSNLYLWTKSGVQKLFGSSSVPHHIKTLADLLSGYFNYENPVQSFLNETFGEVRVVAVDNQPFFVANDIARILDIKNIRKNLAEFDDDEKADVDISYTSSNGVTQNRNVTVINEAGLYRLIFKSRKPEAEEFKRWLAHEVIPAIRQNNYYAAAKNPLLAAKDAEIDALRREVAYLRGRLEKKKPLEYYVVYALLMDNNSVKIGMTKDLTKRIQQIRQDTGLTTIKAYSSRNIPAEDARILESKIKEHFADRCIAGEFFAIDFADACSLIP